MPSSDFFVVGNVAEAPVGVEGEATNCWRQESGVLEDGLAAPPIHGGIDGGSAVAGAVSVVAEGVAPFAGWRIFRINGLGDGGGAGAARFLPGSNRSEDVRLLAMAAEAC